jgi:ankyrin repeat protein
MGMPPQRVKNDGASPLFMAAQSGHVETVKLLLDSGAEV